MQLAWGRSLRFLAAPLATEVYNRESNGVAMLAAGATRDELQVERIALRIQAHPQPPHGAAADFDLIRLENGVEVARDRWTVSLQFTFLDTIDPELMIVNPMGIIVTFLRADQVFVSP